MAGYPSGLTPRSAFAAGTMVLRRRVVAKSRVPGESTRIIGRPASAARRGRLLVIDRDPAMPELLRRELGAEHDVVVSACAREAALTAGREAFDLVVCDLSLPEALGIKLHAAMWQLAPSMIERVVYMTGGPLGELAEGFLASVPNVRIAKPISASTIRELLAKHLR